MNKWITIGAVLLALGVAAGAFGAHALAKRLDEYHLDVYHKAALYHFIHAIGILLVASLSAGGSIPVPSAEKICALLFVSIVVFSGSLYALAITDVRWLGAITPIGGTGFIAAWLWLAYCSWKHASV
ncbi:MAG: DUF423 domain-containing protein [Bdellovibrionales bacterium]|nr:DUF423 domain-containing protein [Bdellovibrionales bacterium]